MRLLLPIILSLFFFISPSEKAVAGSIGQAKQFTHSHESQRKFKHVTLVDECLPIAQINKNRTAASQHRPTPADNFFNTVSSAYREILLRETAYIIRPHFYCKPIGLKLIFPEHYFW